MENQFLYSDKSTGIEVWMKRLDKAFPHAVGNKYFKLKYNFERARELDRDKILTFGGAYSNHISATAELGAKRGFQTIGLIRGEELAKNERKTLKENPTLAFAHQCGMRLEFITRKSYREKHTGIFQKKIVEKYGEAYILPEGGTNALAVKGCEEILTEGDSKFDVLCCPVGTGGTMAGIINASAPHQRVLGFSALRADLREAVKKYTRKTNWRLFPENDFKGFAKINPQLVSFINGFYGEYDILLDPIYTGKMMLKLFKAIKGGFFQKNTRILVVHTGGLQGVAGMNRKLSKKGLATIVYNDEI